MLVLIKDSIVMSGQSFNYSIVLNYRLKLLFLRTLLFCVKNI